MWPAQTIYGSNRQIDVFHVFYVYIFFMRWTWLFVNFNLLWIYSHAPFKIWIILQTCPDTLLSQSHLGGQDSWFGILLKHSGRGRNAKTALYCWYPVINLDWEKALSFCSQLLPLTGLEFVSFYSTMFDVFCVKISLVCVKYFVHNINLK